jgi:predicted ATPase/DNA-binding SARP family transcriptional activator
VEGDLRVALLGPLAVDGPSGPLVVAGLRRQALLALLALATPRPVSDDRLLEALWGDDQPANPANALQAQVSQLRRLLGTDVVARDGNGYRLRIDAEAVDVHRLARLVADGRDALDRDDHASATSCLGQAVALVRGPPLVDLLDLTFAREAASQLEELVLDALEWRADAELAVGHHAELVGELAELVAEHPLRERLHAQLVLALYRSGRQADALRAVQEVRTLLREELGVDPGPELIALEGAVLTHDPALASPERVRGATAEPTLPVPLTSFVGREQELATVLDAVATSRLVTVVALGGMGKTRVVIEAAHRLALDGDVRFVELGPVTDPVAVPEAIATSLGAQDQVSSDSSESARSPDARTVDHVRDQELVVVLDNAEHVAEAVAASVTTLLRGCPRLRIVVTSRQPLGVAGERAIDLGPMADEDAARLFADRAQAVQPRFAPDDATGEVAALCARLDRLPLAIELAAARTRTLPLAEIAERLDDRFDLLRAGGRVGDGGHDGLRAAIDWSYESLFDDERAVFCRLAVFAGGATSETVAELFGAEALDLVERLVDKSLVVADTEGERARFRMLDSLRAYGVERLREDGELDAAQAAHLQWCIDLGETAAPHIHEADQMGWLRRLDVEHDNLRAALAHASTADPTGGLRLIGSLIQAWYFWGRKQEARHWAEACLAADTDAPDPVRSKVLSWVGLLADVSTWTSLPGGIEAELALADERLVEAAELLGPDGDAYAVACVQRMVVLVRVRQLILGLPVDTVVLEELLRSTSTALTDLDKSFDVSLVYSLWGVSHLFAGDLPKALEAAEWARVYAERCGDRFSRARAAWLSGTLAEASGDLVGAYGHFEEGVRLVSELGMEQHVTAQAAQLARLAEANGEPALAEQWRAFVAERSWAEASWDDLATAAMARNVEGLAVRAAGQLDDARACHDAAQAWYVEGGVAAGVAFTRSCLGFLATEVGDLDVAREHHLAALAAAVDAAEAGALGLAMEGVASVLGDTSAGQAATLLGGGQARWSNAAGGREAIHERDVAATVARVRATLGDVAYDAAFAEGEHLDDREVVVLARSATRLI